MVKFSILSSTISFFRERPARFSMAAAGGLVQLSFDVAKIRKIFHSTKCLSANFCFSVGSRFVFTNSLLNEYDLHDRYCNLIMDIFQDLSPEVVVNSPLLEEYLRNNYPTASFISSTTKRLRDSEAQLKEFTHDYKYICLDYDYNYDFDFLDSIQEKERNRVEILINSTCPKGCNARVLHQEFSNRRQLEYDNDGNCESEEFFKNCPKIRRCLGHSSSGNGNSDGLYGGTNYILPQDLDKYLDKGYSHFKIQGRELKTSQLFAEFLPYLIRPEYYQMATSIIDV